MSKGSSSQESDVNESRLVIDVGSIKGSMQSPSFDSGTSVGSSPLTTPNRRGIDTHPKRPLKLSGLSNTPESWRKRRKRLIVAEDTHESTSNSNSPSVNRNLSIGENRRVSSPTEPHLPTSSPTTQRVRGRKAVRAAVSRSESSHSPVPVPSISETKSEPNEQPAASENTKDPDSDDFCWICHKVGQMVVCSCCPRVYHPGCLHTDRFPETWLCPECQDLVVAECEDYQPSNWRKISKSQLQSMLYFLIDRLAMQSWAEHFREPANTEKLIGYADIVLYPMSLRTLRERNKNGNYSSPQAFLSDFRWILHNCIIYNGSNAPVTSHARFLNRACLREIALMRACPTCYLNRIPALHVLPTTPYILLPMTDNTQTTDQPTSPTPVTPISDLDPWWFCKLCDDIHPVVWVRLQRYPQWPAKLMSVDGDSVLVSFFGDYDLTMAPVGSIHMHADSCTMDNVVFGDNATGFSTVSSSTDAPTSSSRSMEQPLVLRSAKGQKSEPSRDPSYKKALAELHHYIELIRKRHPTFKLPATPLSYSKRLVNRYYGPFKRSGVKESLLCDDIIQSRSEKAKAPETQPACTQSSSETESTIAHIQTLSPMRNSESSSKAKHPRVHKPPSATSISITLVSNTITHSHSSNTNPVQSRSQPDVRDSSPQPVCSPPNCGEAECQKSPVELQSLPHFLSPSCQINETDEVRTLLDGFRSQLNQLLSNMEEKWCATKSLMCSSADQLSGSLRGPPVLSAITVDKETQTEPSSVIPSRCPEVLKVDDHDSAFPSTCTNFQAAMMEAEIERLDQEVKRLHLLLNFTRAEMAFETKHRIAELRRVWNSEMLAVLEAASKIWEQEVVTIVDSVKRKQWCAYCGRLAYYYCCWNTCYCNSTCQSKHWSSHINHCIQARAQNGPVNSNSEPESHLLAPAQLPTVSYSSNPTPPESWRSHPPVT